MGLADALSTLTNVGADVTPLADSLDVAGLGPAVDTAIADATSDPFGLTLDADATPVTDAIDQATSAPQTVPVEADTTSATQAIDGLDSTPITLEVDADTTTAQSALDDLGDSATNAAGGSGGGSEGLAGLEGAVVGIKAASGAAQGEVGGLTDAVGGLSAGLGVAVGAGVGFAAFIGTTTKLAADAEAQNKRFASTFGDLAEQVDQIHVGGLNTTIEQLGQTSGTTEADLKAVASRIGALGQSAGASNDTIVKTTDNLLALGATFSVNNPRLGDAASVTDRLTNAFARGGRALAPFGLALSSAQINAEALSETGKSSAADLTLFEKSTAGANLALKIFGDTLGTKFQEGAQSADVQFRALKVSIEETLVAVGGPLLQPLVDIFTALLPVAQQVGIVLGNLARTILPLVQGFLPVLTPIAGALKLVGDGLSVVAEATALFNSPLVEIVTGLGLLGIAIATVIPDLIELAFAGDLALGPVGWVVAGATALGLLGGALDLFGGHTHQAAIDTTALNDAFAAAPDATAGFTNAVGSLSDAIDTFLTKNLAIKTDGVAGIDVINGLGVSFKSVQDALGGSESSFQKFQSNITTLQANTNQSSAAFDRFHQTLLTGRQTLENNAQASVAAAEASGLVTKAQVKEATATAGATGEHDDYGKTIVDNIAVLQALTPQINAAAAAQATQSRASADSSGAFAHLSGQIRLLGQDQIDATTVSQQLGISVQDAKTFIIEQSDAWLKNADSTLLATSAGKQFTAELQTGALSVRQAQIKFAELGVSIPGVTDAITAAQTAVSSFVDTSLQQLPTVADAFKQATKNSKVNLDTFGTDLQKEIVSIAQFTTNLTTLVSQGFGNLAGFLASEGPQVAGQAAASLSTDANRAKVLDATIGLFGGAQFSAAIKLKKLFPGLSEQAISEATGAIGDAGDAGATAAGGAAEKTGDKFKPDLTKGTKAAISGASNALIGAGLSLGIAASEVGSAIGQNFDLGFAQGITASTPAITSAATAAAAAAEKAAKDKLKVQSPSQVGIAIGQQFSTGLGIGIVDAAPQAADASTVLANAVVKQLQDALRAATSGSSSGVQSAAQSAFTSFLSTAGSSLSTVGTEISASSSALTSALANQAQALTANHKAAQQYADDQQKIADLTRQTGEAFGIAARTGTQAAQDAFTNLAAKLSAAKQQLNTDLGQLTGAMKTFATASHALDVASDPATFTKNLREQNAQANEFAKDLAKLSKEGFADLAKQLADAGPQAAGALAKGFAASPAKAKSAEAAVDAAGTFATNYQAELTRLFGPSGGAVNAAQTAGQTIGQALTTGLQVSSQAGTAAALASLSAQIAAGVPQVIPLVAAPQIQKALTPVAANAPTIIQTPTLAGQTGTQSLELDLTIVLDDGRTVTAQTSVPIAPTQRTLKQLVRASVHAS